MEVETTLPLSFEINVFPKEGYRDLRCEDISVHFDFVGQFDHNEDEIKETIELQCSPAKNNKKYKAMFFKINPTTQESLLKSKFFELPTYSFVSQARYSVSNLKISWSKQRKVIQ